MYEHFSNLVRRKAFSYGRIYNKDIELNVSTKLHLERFVTESVLFVIFHKDQVNLLYSFSRLDEHYTTLQE